MDKLLLSLQNKKHSQMPIIILPCVCCLQKLFSVQNEEESEHSCDNEVRSNKHKDKTKKHHHHHHHHDKHISEEDNSSKTKEKKEEIIDKKNKRKHSIVEEHKNKKNKTHNKKVKLKEIIESNVEYLKNDNENKDKEKEKEENDEDNNDFEIKKAEFSLRISKPQWIPPRVKYGERIGDNPKPKKQRKPRKKQQKNDKEYIEKNRNSISFTPTVEKKKEPYFKLLSEESEYESVDNPLVGDKIQFKLFDCEMEGDEMSFPNFSESEVMIGIVIGKNVIDDVEHIVMKLENGETNTYPLTLMSDVRLISRSSENRN